MHKNIIKSVIAGAFVLATAGFYGCGQQEPEVCEAPADGSVKVKILLPVTKSEAAYDAMRYSTVRIYQVERGVDDSQTRNLVRRYRPASSMPEQLYLAADEYVVVVEAGKGENATFTDKTYYGEKEFVLETQQSKTVEVKCSITNIAVKVEYDQTVREAFDKSFTTWVSASDEFSKTDAQAGTVPSLEYTDDATGFFILPEGVSNISWGFEGHSSDEDIELKGRTAGVIENAKSGVQYTLTFKYSPDYPGSISMEVQTREYEEMYEDFLVFSPQPVISLTGLEENVLNVYKSGEAVMTASTLNPLTDIKITSGERTWNVMTAGVPSEDNTANGLTLSAAATAATLTFTEAFFNTLPGGTNTLNITVTDRDQAQTSVEREVITSGANGISSTDLWFGHATVSAVLTQDAATDVKIRYRLSGTEDWNEAVANTTSQDYIYSAVAEEITAEKDYELQLVVDGVEKGAICTVRSMSGVQMPNAGFEDWHQNGNPWYPYASGGEEFWGTGNPGSYSVSIGKNVTTYSTDVRPGSTGGRSAKLETASVVGQLAAGNIFVGAFGGTKMSGGNIGGYVHMGRSFEFNAKPKALRLWYKYTPSGSDQGRIFVCLVNMTNGDTYHVVDTTLPDATTFSPDDEFLYTDKQDHSTLQGHVIAYADKMLSETVSDWTMVEIPITYRDQYSSEKSNVLIVTATASYRGDYFEGAAGSLLFVDDVEFVY